jgi:hypothetical protein
MTIERPKIPQPVTQLKNEIAVFAPIRKFTFYRLISQISKKVILDIAKKKKTHVPIKVIR